jgi:protein gp37
MNDQRDGGIEYVTFTVNPISGCLSTKCPFCYARAIYKRYNLDFTPQFHPERMKNFDKISKKKEKQRVFVGSVTDMWGDGVMASWLDEVFRGIENVPQHDFLTLTKQPRRVKGEHFPPNAICGMTVIGLEEDEYFDQIEYQWGQAKRRFISFEPLLNTAWRALKFIQGCEFIIIGSQTKPNVAMDKHWVDEIEIEAHKHRVPIIHKHNFLVKE